MRSQLEALVPSRIANHYRFVLWMFIPLVLLFASISLVTVIAHHSIVAKASHDMISIVAFIDKIMVNADHTALRSLTLINRPCRDIVGPLQLMSLKYPLVRSVNLSLHGLLYCTPVPLQPLSFPHRVPSLSDDSASDIRLNRGTVLFPDFAVIVLRKRSGDFTAGVVIDTQYIRHTMNLLGSGSQMLLVVNNMYLTPQGEVEPVKSLSRGFVSLKVPSADYPFKLRLDMTVNEFIHSVLDIYGYVMLLCICLAIIISLLIHHWLQASSSLYFNMRQALERKEFKAYFQPIMNAREGYCSGIEVLTRWYHPTDGTVSPDIFIPLAEKSGLIIPLTQQLMRDVASIISTTPISWRHELHVAFNITALHLANRQIVEDSKVFLSVVQGKRIKLILELTERQFIDVNDTTLGVLEELKALDIGVAMDDFGTGYSGLSYLNKMNIDTIKLDQSFVAMIEKGNTAKIIVDVVINLASQLDIEVVAEGVENTYQQNYLLSKNVQYQQGYLFARPMPMLSFSCWWQAENTDQPAQMPPPLPRQVQSDH